MTGVNGAALVLTATLFGVACASQGSGDPAAQSTCVSTASFDGTAYVSRHVQVHPVPGEALGQARVPGCNDTGQAQAPPDEFVDVARLPGVDPSIAVVSSDFPEVIYIRADLRDIPPDVMAYFNPPGCQPADIPITLEGRGWGSFSRTGTRNWTWSRRMTYRCWRSTLLRRPTYAPSYRSEWSLLSALLSRTRTWRSRYGSRALSSSSLVATEGSSWHATSRPARPRLGRVLALPRMSPLMGARNCPPDRLARMPQLGIFARELVGEGGPNPQVETEISRNTPCRTR
jgi:hypothetical protein